MTGIEVAALGAGALASAGASAGAISTTTAGVISAVSGAVTIASSLLSAYQGSQAAKSEAKYAKQVAQMEAEAQREDDRHAAARARARQYSGVEMSSGSPLFDDLENARRIDQRYQDRIFQGRVAAAQSRGRIPGIWTQGLSQAAQGGLSIASGLYRMKAPRPSTSTSLMSNP